MFSLDAGYTHYVNVVPRNVFRVFPTGDKSASESLEQFNEAQSYIEIEEDTLQDQHILEHRAVRDTSSDLHFISQRQVVHRHVPARPAADTTTDDPSGRWQWNQLLQNTKTNTTGQ